MTTGRDPYELGLLVRLAHDIERAVEARTLAGHLSVVRSLTTQLETVKVQIAATRDKIQTPAEA